MHKKISLLLASTMLASGLVASLAFAEATAPTLSINGFVRADAAHANQKSAYTGSTSKSGFSRDTKLRADSEIAFNIHGGVDAFDYGGVLTFDTDWRGEDTTKPRMEDAYVHAENKLGRLEFGSVESASKRMKVDASDIAAATGGIGAKWYDFFSTNVRPTIDHAYKQGDAAHADFDIESSLLLDTSDLRANRISYYSPVWNGVQFGASFAPDTDKDREFTGKYSTDIHSHAEDDPIPDAIGAENIINAAITYETCIDDVMFKGGIMGAHAQAERDYTLLKRRFKPYSSYGAGAQLSYSGFSFAGSYVDNGTSFAEKVSLANAASTPNTQFRHQLSKSNYWTLGAAYTQGPATVSLTYLESNRDHRSYKLDYTTPSIVRDGTLKNSFSNLALSFDYKLAPGFKAYAEAFLLEAKSKRNGATQVDGYQSTEKNRGTLVLVGTRLDF